MNVAPSLIRLVAVTLLSLSAFNGAAAQGATEPSGDTFAEAPGGWRTYANARFGTRFEFPAGVFTPEAAPTDGDGRSFTSSDARLELYSRSNLDGATAASTRRDLLGSDNYRRVTYNPIGKDWLVLSGYRGETIFYEKYFFRDGVISGFGIEFPKERKPFYAPMVERMENSFRAGRSD